VPLRLAGLLSPLKNRRSLKERKREVPSDFDIVASTYDTLVQRNPGYVEHLQLSSERLELANEGEGMRLLDLCCGTGLSTGGLATAYPKATIIGLDASQGMLDVAKKKVGLTKANITFVHGDAMDPAVTLGAQEFDGILMAYGIRNMTDPDLCLDRLMPLLKPGAPICFHEYSVADSPRAKGTWTSVCWGIIIPAGLITSRHTRIYRYLWQSVMQFDGVKKFEQRLGTHGFVDIRTLPVAGRVKFDFWQDGVLHSFLAKRPAAVEVEGVRGSEPNRV
jgi:ubiquinone/menaquinone biosynthesis C-methylase UbiE